VDLVLTDPPYGVNLGHTAGAKESRPGLLKKRGGYDDSPERFRDVVVPAVTVALSLAKRGMVFGVPPMIWEFPAPAAIGGIYVSAAVGLNCWGWSNFIHCLLYGSAPDLQRGGKPTGIASNAGAERTGHPTTKPLVWIRWAMSLGSRPGELVLDPFAGSGTTLRAAKDMHRRAIGIEICEAYCEIAARRLQQQVLPLPEPADAR
jgi:DNA modification methylase